MTAKPLDALGAIAARHSTRAFNGEPIAKPLLEQIIDAGRLAPTANNVQPWEFVVLTEKAARKRIADLTDWGKFIAEASACVVVFCKDAKYYLEDGCAATENILVAAAALGVDSCWVAGDKKAYAPAVAEALGVPAGFKLVSLLALGYASGPAQTRDKRPLSDVLHWEKF
jgi:nitroreductase